ncbi:MAG: hypothetical protein HZR80_16905 [Candidatus Heimdallarchaeota archaeon]
MSKEKTIRKKWMDNTWEPFPKKENEKIEYLNRFLECDEEHEELITNILFDVVRKHKSFAELLIFRIRELDKNARLSYQFMNEGIDEIDNMSKKMMEERLARSFDPTKREQEEYDQQLHHDYMMATESSYRRSVRQVLYKDLEKLCEFYKHDRKLFVDEDGEKVVFEKDIPIYKYPAERMELFHNLKTIFKEFEKGFEKEK